MLAISATASGADKSKVDTQTLDKNIMLTPGFVRNHESTAAANSCDDLMKSYWYNLFTRDAAHASINSPGTFSKNEYYVFATFLSGKNSEYPVEKEEMIDKYKQIIDSDHKKIMGHIKHKGLFLFAGDYAGDIRTLSAPDFEVIFQFPNLPNGEYATSSELYDIENNKFYMQSRFSFGVRNPLRGRYSDKSRKALDRNDNISDAYITASAKEWRDHLAPLLMTPEGRSKLGSRVLVDGMLHPVYNEVFDRQTGAVLLEWGDAKKYRGKIPIQSYADSHHDNCDITALKN